MVDFVICDLLFLDFGIERAEMGCILSGKILVFLFGRRFDKFFPLEIFSF